MSRHYNSRDTFPYAFVMFFFVLIVFPIVPITILAVIILLLFHIGGLLYKPRLWRSRKIDNQQAILGV